MKYLFGIIVAVVIAVGGGLAFMSDSAIDAKQSADGLQIATSFYSLAYALERIVGDAGSVSNIGAGRDPHDFSPSTKDILALQQADLVVLQGADFEPWGDATMDRLKADDVPVLIATTPIELHEGGHDHGEAHDEHEDHDEHNDHDENEEDSYDGHDHGAYDPHTWLDPVLFAQSISYLSEAIIELDPTNASVYEMNTEALLAEIAELDSEYASRLESCLLDEVITSHDAFGYLGDRYGFEVHAIAGLSTQDTPSVVTLAELRAEAAEGIGAILLEESSVAAFGETLARETGLQTLSINPIAHVIPAGSDYLTLMRDNLNVFATALACNG